MTIAALVVGKPFQMGATGDGVKQVQLALRSIGYALTGTGYFGPATDTAVETFQKRAGLPVTGVVDSPTAVAIDNSKAAPQIAQQASKAEIGRPLWLEAGIKLINVKETPGSRDTAEIIDWAKEEGGDISKAYAHDSIPWCALFANHILTKAGIKGTETLWALDFAGHWPSVKLAGPAVGAFAPMKRTGGGHIICIVGKDQHGNVMGLGGNQSDQVSIVPFPVARLNQGFWWPKGIALPATGMSALPLVKSNGRLSSSEA
jgi:uncharacterized protein (TIGR02594 family)